MKIKDIDFNKITSGKNWFAIYDIVEPHNIDINGADDTHFDTFYISKDNDWIYFGNTNDSSISMRIHLETECTIEENCISYTDTNYEDLFDINLYFYFESPLPLYLT